MENHSSIAATTNSDERKKSAEAGHFKIPFLQHLHQKARQFAVKGNGDPQASLSEDRTIKTQKGVPQITKKQGGFDGSTLAPAPRPTEERPKEASTTTTRTSKHTQHNSSSTSPSPVGFLFQFGWALLTVVVLDYCLFRPAQQHDIGQEGRLISNYLRSVGMQFKQLLAETTKLLFSSSATLKQTVVVLLYISSGLTYILIKGLATWLFPSKVHHTETVIEKTVTVLAESSGTTERATTTHDRSRQRRPSSTLNPQYKNHRKYPWQQHANIHALSSTNRGLQRLKSALLHVRRSRKNKKQLHDSLLSTKEESNISTQTEEIPDEDDDVCLSCQTSSEMGSFDKDAACVRDASSLIVEDDENVLSPCLQLRGMDVFLSNEEEEESIGTHPWLLQQGLRKVPTMVGNVHTQWGNVLLYFEMPSWVKNWEDATFEEHERDSLQTKGLKRFLRGSDQYRNLRLKLVPSLIDAPRAVKLVAPPKREFTVSRSILPVYWKKYPAEERTVEESFHDDEYEDDTSTGTPRSTSKMFCHPLLECRLDCLSVRAMRLMASIVKNNLHRMTIDVALVIGQPNLMTSSLKNIELEEDEQEDNTLHVTLGIFRIDHVDISSCPVLPSRKRSSEPSVSAPSSFDEEDESLSSSFREEENKEMDLGLS